jgi:hypothetical protein
VRACLGRAFKRKANRGETRRLLSEGASERNDRNCHQISATLRITGTFNRAQVDKVVGCLPAILFPSAIRSDESEPR